MFGFNWVDGIIVILLTLATIKGIKVGFVTQLFIGVGFFTTLFVAGWLFPHLLPLPNQTIRTVVNASCVLFTALYLALRSADLGRRIHWSFKFGTHFNSKVIKAVEAISGGISGLIAGILLVWLLGVAIGRLPFTGLSNSANDARIIQGLVRHLPPVPAVFAQFDRHIDPNSTPYISAPLHPTANFNYSAIEAEQAEVKASPSLVRLTGFGCGGIVSGTGFAISKHLIATNAHVIAGVTRPIVKYRSGSYEGTPVFFDATLDLAVLYVPGLSLPKLALADSTVRLGSTVAVLGFPGGNYQTTPGIIQDTLAVSASNIYDQGSFGRGVYVVQTHVSYGSSGSPIVLGSGAVAGIIFSKPVTYTNYAYALTSPHITDALHKLKSPYRRVGTGACMVD